MSHYTTLEKVISLFTLFRTL